MGTEKRNANIQGWKTPGEAAKIWGVAPTYVYSLIRQNRMKATQRNGLWYVTGKLPERKRSGPKAVKTAVKKAA